MRFREFKPILLEFAPPTGKGSNDLQILSNIIEIVDPTDPLYSVAMGIIKNLVSTIKQPEEEPVPALVAQPQAASAPKSTALTVQQQQTAPAEEEPLAEEIEPGDEPWYESFVALMGNPTAAEEMLKRLRTEPQLRDSMRMIQKGHEGAIEKSFAAGSTEALVTIDDFFKKVKESADLLAGKAVGILDELRKWYHEEAVRQKVPDQPLPIPRPKVTTNALYRKLLYPLENIFQDLGFQNKPPDLRSFKEESPRILNFMKQCESGIIEFNDLLDMKEGNIASLIHDEDLVYIYEKIFDKLLALDAGQGGGAWGPGELGLSILCKPVSKSLGKGDLSSISADGSAIDVEVKASRNANSGGRLGGSGVLAGSAGKKIFISALKALCDTADVDPSNIGKNFTEDFKYKTVKGVKTKVGTGKKKESGSVKSTSVTSPKWFDSFNAQIPPGLQGKRGVNPQGAVAEFLITAVGAVVSEKGRPFFDEEMIASIPNEDGTIDYEKFKTILTAAWYQIYSQTDNVGIILVLNPTNGNFTVINSGDMLTSGESSVVITGGIDFDDSQGKAGPQVGIA
jgi:hypothetical protein